MRGGREVGREGRPGLGVLLVGGAVRAQVGAGRVEFQRGEALREILHGALGCKLRVLVDVRLVSGTGIDIGVGAQPLVNASAEEVVDRLPGLLADDVPAGHLERAQHSHECEIGVLRIAGRVHAPPDVFDVMRIFAGEITSEHIDQHLRDDIRMKGHAVGFADAMHVAVGGQLHEHEVATADARLWVAGDECLDVGELHRGNTNTNRSYRPRRGRA